MELTFLYLDDYVVQLEGFFIGTRLSSMIHYLGLPDVFNWLPEDIQKSSTREFGAYANGESFLFSGTPFWE